MAEIFQNREQIIEHVGIYIAEHRKRFSCIAGAFGQPIAGVQHRSVWLGLNAGALEHPIAGVQYRSVWLGLKRDMKTSSVTHCLFCLFILNTNNINV